MNEKILGVLGGMGPAASAEFMKILAEKVPAGMDQDHPVVYMLSDPKIPDRSRAIVGDGKSPESQIRGDLEKLIEWGAEVLAVPCNTAHYFIDRFRSELSVPLVHIVEATLEEAVKNAPDGAWMVSSLGTVRAGIYQTAAEKMGYRLFIPPEDIQRQMQEVITFVKSGDIKNAAQKMEASVDALWRIKEISIITACTELPLAYDASSLPLERNISSLNALADACIKEIGC
ncbi:MAG: amino acid racemase [Synergistaceae bacterium]|nr:amino acid racemase [Synergistaceae bacterium]